MKFLKVIKIVLCTELILVRFEINFNIHTTCTLRNTPDVHEFLGSNSTRLRAFNPVSDGQTCLISTLEQCFTPRKIFPTSHVDYCQGKQYMKAFHVFSYSYFGDHAISAMDSEILKWLRWKQYSGIKQLVVQDWLIERVKMLKHIIKYIHSP